MAVELGKLVAEAKETIELEALSNKTIAIDAYNTIYQFLSIIRQPDGTPLVDSKGRVTSHLSGLLYRTTNLLEKDITPVYVFDGIPPALKRRTLEARAAHREEAKEAWQRAKAEGLLEEAKTYAMASSKVDKSIVESSKALLKLMGIPYMQAPSEGEAQGAYLVRNGMAYAMASQDYDSFLFGANVVVRNITITGRRKLPRKGIYVDVNIERVELEKLLKVLGVSRKQLVWLGMLMGTDFNEGIEKVGPKTALKIVKEHDSLEKIVAYVKDKYGREFDVEPQEVEDVFLKPDVNEVRAQDFDRLLKEARPDQQGLMKFMCDEHGFSPERIGKYAEKLVNLRGRRGQKGINSWME